MPPKNPLEIPEVTDHVVSFLSGNDLASCIRVSKSWHDMFICYRWRIVRRSHRWSANSHKHFGPSQEALLKYRHLVQELYIQGPFRENEMGFYPSLRNLYIDLGHHSRWRRRNDRESFDWNLAKLSPSLQRLSLTNADMEPSSLQSLSGHSRLRSLVLLKTRIKADAVPEFWKAFKSLGSLSMDGVRFEGRFVSVPTDTVFDRMSTLTIKNVRGLDPSKQLAVAFHCPLLESFELKILAFRARIVIHHPVLKDRWPQLDNLDITVNPEDAEWAFILKGIGNCFGHVASLNLNSGTFGPQSLKALDSHFCNLVDLRISDSPSSVVRDVLCSCPMLEILHAPDIYASDIAGGGPWVCQQLRELKICFRVWDTEQDLQLLVFEHLSALVRLATLDMSRGIDDGSDRGVLEFRRDCGLGQLANLQELRAVGFHFQYKIEQTQRLGRGDVEWMIGTWKSLKGIYGHLNQDMKVNAELVGLLRYHGILLGECMRHDGRLDLS